MEKAGVEPVRIGVSSQLRFPNAYLLPVTIICGNGKDWLKILTFYDFLNHVDCMSQVRFFNAP